MVGMESLFHFLIQGAVGGGGEDSLFLALLSALRLCPWNIPWSPAAAASPGLLLPSFCSLKGLLSAPHSQVPPAWARLAASRQLFGSWRLRLMPLYKWYVRVKGRGDSSKQQRLA